ncbi:zinc-binding metallopeptidase family protein [Mycoplasmopsis cynos]|uniref:M42 family peptidase n=1 Tax=Mycoplasmopsis cynos TaxID=171284 RepID=UPI002AFDCF62|nr:M42 family peptidase [Mycoplasmopsis cynos]WQQ17390.1 M42 family peptidase [Mycoplasmopsis cynos]
MKKLEFKQRLIKYMNIEAMSRYEQPVARELKANISSKYKVSYDKFGSIIFHKPSKNENALKIMIAAHMDEVGYLVKSITQKGQILLSPVGGIWASTVIGTKAKLITTQNKEFLGVFGHTSIHIMERDKITKAISNDELYADFGFMSQEEAIQKGVEIGDRVQISGETVFFENEDLIGGKSMDNRAGVSVLEYIANNLANIDLDVDLYLVGTVQEEVGTRGARTSVSLIKPDIAIALDTTSSHDTYGTIPGTTELFRGAAIRIKDNGTLMDPKLVSLMMKTAKNHQIKAYKFIAAGGGTDAAELQFSPNGGASVLTISLPQRYLHSPIGVCAISDLLAAGDLLTSFIKDFDSRKWNN